MTIKQALAWWWARAKPVKGLKPLTIHEVAKVILVRRITVALERAVELEDEVDTLEDVVGTAGSRAGNAILKGRLADLRLQLMLVHGEVDQMRLLLDSLDHDDLTWFEVARLIGPKF